jgi:hypothetical protein
MIKDYKHIVNLEQGATSTPEVQPVAFKAMEEEKKEPTPNRLPIDTSKLNNEEMALIIKSFRQILKQRRGRTTSLAPRKCATGVVSPVTLLLNVQFLVKVTGTRTKREEEGEEEILQEEGRRCPHMPGMGLRRELHRLLRRGRCQHRHQQGPPLPQHRPQVSHG